MCAQKGKQKERKRVFPISQIKHLVRPTTPQKRAKKEQRKARSRQIILEKSAQTTQKIGEISTLYIVRLTIRIHLKKEIRVEDNRINKHSNGHSIHTVYYAFA